MSESVQHMQQTENKYHSERLEMIKAFKNSGINPYPHKFQPTLTFAEYASKYDGIEAGARKTESVERIAGRVMTKRESSKKLRFYTLQQNGMELQMMADFNHYVFTDPNMPDQDKRDAFVKITSSIMRGDIIGITGFVGKSHKGELSIFPHEIIILAPCLHLLPTTFFGIKDEELRERKRFLDLIINKDSKTPFLIRSSLIKFIRKYLDDRNFMEVQTPVLTPQAGGASAKPFMTYHNDHKMNMALRIAPELYLKQLVVGGFDRVYEIGAQFRNESIDRTHSPEFTSLEFYMAYADYNDLMAMAEEIFSQAVFSIHGKYKIMCAPFDSGTQIEIDFTPPFKRYDFIKEIEAACGKTLPTDLTTLEANQFLQELCKEFSIECSNPRTTSRLLDKLCGHFIESKCTNPTFVINHPLIMSPLAKWHRENTNITERFELFIMGFEFANAYTELNDPTVQRQTFEDQMLAKASGDEEAHTIDETFVCALEYGLPPTGGFGIGIDRLVMALSGSKKIQDVILFPTLRQ